jgi:hypothetical protein
MCNYDNLTKNCKNIIKNNNTDIAINMIAKLRFPVTNELIGKNGAIKIFKAYSECAVGYDSKKYSNNFRSYNNKIKKKFTEANSM